MSHSKTVLTNVKALLALQTANYIFPFLILPYLTRVLGAELYGIVAYGLAISQIAFVVTDFGFTLSATYSISKHRDDLDHVRKVIGSVFAIKVGLICIVALALSAYLCFDTKYVQYHSYFWLMIITVIGQAFQPLWFFQGVERMTNITIYTLGARTLYLILIFLLVKQASDYHWVAIANGVSHLVAAGIGIGMMIRIGSSPLLPEPGFIRKIFFESLEFFWSRLAVSTYTAGGAFYLGLVSSPINVAHYAAAEQLYKGGQAVMTPLHQSLLPHMIKHKNYSLLFKAIRIALLVTCLGLTVGALGGHQIIHLFFGSSFQESYPILVIFLVTLVVNTTSILIGFPLLGALGMVKLANLSVVCGGLFQISVLFVSYLAGWQSAVWVATTVLLTETMVFGMRAYWSMKYYQPHQAKLDLGLSTK